MWCHIFKERWHLVKKNPLCTTYFEVSVHLSVHQFVSPSICLCWWLIPCSSPLKLLPFLPLFLLYRCWINVCDINMAAIQNLMKLVLNATSVRHQCEIRESSRHSLKGQLSRLSLVDWCMRWTNSRDKINLKIPVHKFRDTVNYICRTLKGKIADSRHMVSLRKYVNNWYLTKKLHHCPFKIWMHRKNVGLATSRFQLSCLSFPLITQNTHPMVS